jgi:hypothetical protein
MRKRSDGIARVGSRESARGSGLGSYPLWEGGRAILCLRLILREVGFVHSVACEGKLLLSGGRVA